jgi:hypothetical protein
MKQIYAVTFRNAEGTETVSRYFHTLRGARAWVRWLNTTNFGHCVRIMAGGPGGMEV